jgi:hypothetical protein
MKKLEINIEYTIRDILLFSVTNTLVPPTMQDNRYQTTKKNKDIHGMADEYKDLTEKNHVYESVTYKLHLSGFMIKTKPLIMRI